MDPYQIRQSMFERSNLGNGEFKNTGCSLTTTSLASRLKAGL